MPNPTNKPRRTAKLPASPSGYARGGGPRGRKAGAEDASPDATHLLYGIHALDAALRNPDRQFHKLRLTDNAEHRLAEALAIRSPAIPIERVRPRDLDRLLGADTVHQGAAADVEPLTENSLAEAAEQCVATNHPILILDHVTDPHNVGAILRSATAFGAVAVVMTRRHSPPLGGALAKSASGALDVIPVVLVQNLGDALEQLTKDGIRLVGFDGGSDAALDDIDLSGPIAMVLGAEGKGLRARTKELCDLICRIETPGQLASLNVSNAAAVGLHLAALHRKRASVKATST